ncbi:MAG TPA: FtsX-like permease family protein [Opitutaceae bacterium]|jgi:putative ABC transport system permease protein|nr:FtsX-like permease family protein [Opitutaceae bacterium]
MSFVLNMAWRDSRASRRRLVLYSLSVVLGIAALVSIGSFSANVRSAIDSEAKGLLGADLFVTSPAQLTVPVTDFLSSLRGEVAREQTFSSMMTFPAIKRLRLVQVHAVQGAFPFYGKFETEPAGAIDRLREGGDVAVIEPTLMAQFGVKVGDQVKMGKTLFTVVGSVKKVPGESPGVAMMAPRAYIPMPSLASTGLASGQALARYRAMVRLPSGADADAIVKAMREKFPLVRLSFETVAERKKNLGQAIAHLDGFLSLVGFVALVLGGIGVASALHAYIRQKIATVAILRCLGASARQGFSVYLVQGFALGVGGACAGGLVGVAVQMALPALFRGVLPIDIQFFVSWPALLRGMGAGVVICILFSVLPLLAVRRIPPLAALRSAVADDAAASPDPLRLAIGAAIAVAVAVFAVWQTASLAVGLGFAGMLGTGFLILAGLGVLVAWMARKFTPRGLPYVVRQGLANLHRPNNRTVLLLVSLGLGTFLVLTLFLVRTTLLNEISGADALGRPNLIFFDIQDDQIAPLTTVAAGTGTPIMETAAIVTMKISAIRGRTVDEMLADKEAHIAEWGLRREYRSTFRGSLSDTEKLVEGKFTGKAMPGTALVPISVEQELAHDMRLHLGDEVDWDVQGLPIRTEVGSIRAVEWRRLEPNFFVVFPEGVLENAPKTYLAAIHAATPADSANVQRAVVDAFPNVTAIDLALVVQTLDGIFSKVAFAIQFMALFTVATGLVVLAGAVLTGRHQRIRETVLLRTLGASRRQLALIQFVEYSVLGIQGAVVGAILAIVGNELLARFVFHVEASAPVGQIGAAIAIVASLSVITGFLAGRGVVDHPPLEVLRLEA